MMEMKIDWNLVGSRLGLVSLVLELASEEGLAVLSPELDIRVKRVVDDSSDSHATSEADDGHDGVCLE